MPVVVLQALARERCSAGGRAHQETAPAGIAERPYLIPGALEPEHRIEDVERDHRVTVGGIGGSRGREAGHGAGLGDSLLEDLSIDRFAILQYEI